MNSGTFKSNEFLQRKKTLIDSSQGLCSDRINCVLNNEEKLFIGTDSGLSLLKNKKITTIKSMNAKNVSHLFCMSDKCILAASDNEIFSINNTKSKLYREYDSKVIDIYEFNGRLWVLTEESVYCTDLNTGVDILHRGVEGGKGRCIAVSEDNIYVGTDSNLSVVHGKRMEWKNIMPRFSNMPDSSINSLMFDESGYLWIGTDSGACVFNNRDLWLTSDKVNTLPKNSVYKIVCDCKGNKYYASDAGVIIQSKGALKYLTAERWTPSNIINDLAVNNDGSILYIATDKGLSVIESFDWTFEDKCNYYEDLIENYHIRRGFIAGRTVRNHCFTDGEIGISDNDGLWTGCYVAAESFRYAATKDKEALEKARRGLQAMLLLTRITDIPGFTARAVRYPDDRSYGDGNKEWHLSSDGVTEWKGETSSDEMTGHFFGMSVYYDLCANKKEKKEIEAALTGIMTHILDNNFRLIDTDGKPTTWACWDPELLNHSDKWFFEKGTNSLELLAFLKICHHITGDDKYDSLYKKFVSVYSYPLNVMQYKIRDAHTCHIDDNLCFLAQLSLLRLEENESLRSIYLCGMEDHYQYEKIENQPLFIIIYAAMTGRDYDLGYGIKSLREIPVDLTHFKMINSVRKDLVYDDEQEEWHEPVQLKIPLAFDERNVHRPDASVFEYDTEDFNGTQEPTVFLLPYWIGRYYGLIG